MIGVTGTSGFIGSHFRVQIRERKLSFRCLDRDPRPDQANSFRGDLFDQSSLNRFCQGLSLLVHLAGIVRGEAPGLVRRVNVEGTGNLLRAAAAQGVGKIIHISSGSVDFLSGEYAESKREAEALVLASGLQWVITRPAEIYGPGDRAGITSLIAPVRRWPLFPVIGSGEYTLQPLHVSDLVNAIMTIIERFDRCRGRIIHLAGPAPVTMNTIVREVGDAVGKRVRPIHIPVKPALFMARMMNLVPALRITDPEQIRRVTVSKRWDISPARELLDFSPMDFSEGMKRTVSELS